MGKEKRLFLLAVMTVMMSTVGYGAVIEMPKEVNKNTNGITVNEGDTSVIKQETTIKDNKIGIVINGGEVINEKNNTIKVIGKATGIEIEKGNFGNNGTIDIKQGTGIKISRGTLNNTGEIKVNHATNGVGIELLENEATNDGTITVTNGTGVKLSGTNGERTFTNKGTIAVTAGKGIILNNEKDTVVNDKEITVTGGTGNGVSMSAGNFTNSETGTITVSGGKGIEQTGGTSINNGKIDVSNSGSIGINQSGGTSSNSGLINVLGSGTGVSVSGGIFTNTGNTDTETDKKGIHASGIGSTGINQSNGTVNNSGLVKSEAGATGVSISNGSFSNTGTIIAIGKAKDENDKDVQSVGIKQLGGTVTSSGTITVNGGVGAEILNGNFTNTGTITVATGNGIKSSGGTITNDGTITINKGTGIGVNKSTFNNNNNITVQAGKGIYLSTGGTLKNDGTIKVSGGTGIDQRDGILNNNGKINVTNGTGVSLVKGTFNNNGNGENGLHVSGSGNVGINQSEGTGNNTGLIRAEDGATGIELSKGTFNNNGIKDENDKVVSLGKVEVSGAGTIGINQTGGTFNNYAVIEVKNGATGVKLSNGTFNADGIKDKEGKKVISPSKINVSGENSIGLDISGKGKLDKILGLINVSGGATGIKIGENTEKEIKYNGPITVNGGVGVEVLSKKGFENKKEITVNSGTAIKVDKQGTANNTGTITVNSGTGAEVLSGTLTNNKTIKADGESSVGVTVNGGTFENKKDVNVVNNALGIKVLKGEAVNKNKIYISYGTGVEVENGKFTNENLIDVAGGQKGNAGVKLKNGVFVNSGEIKGKGFNGAALAIESMGGNNTVFLKNGSKVTGKIVGADGIDVLALEGTEKGQIYNGLNVENYEKISVVKGNVKIGKDSKIELEYNKDEEGYKDKTNEIIGETSSGNLTMSGSSLIIDFKDSLTNPNGSENPIIDVGTDGKLIFGEGMKLDFTSSDGRDVFNVNEALGLKDGQIEFDKNVDFNDIFKDTAVWEYDQEAGEIIAKKHKYEDVVLKSELKDFAGIFGNQKNFADKYKDTLGNLTTELNLLETKGEFTNIMTQMSGGVHGYIVDFAALNARTMTNTMRNRALTRDYMRKRPLNSWTQDISYIDNNHRLGGLMNVDYTEKGVLGISEKQILPNGRIGLVYGGSKGNAKFEDGANGSSSLDGAYFGGYYNHEFNDKWSLNSNINFVYTHNKVTRNIDIIYKDKDKKEIKNPIFKSTYPTYTFGTGTSIFYTVKDDLRNKAHFYAGVDVEKIMAGNIHEARENKEDKTGLAVKSNADGGRTYYSIVPSAGFMVQNTGYVFDRKYRIGADLNWETEVGNIKDGKRIKLTGLDKEYKIETSERENIFSYSLFGALDLTESLSVNARYTSMFSDEYDSDMIGAGFEYKMDTMADNIFGDFAHRLENRRTFSDRWGMTLGFMMETDDADDATAYTKDSNNNDIPTIGENITSMEYKPRLTLSINDKKSNWSYFFDTYHKTNDLFGSRKGGEKESHATRIHGEARWNDTYSKGTYGMSIGYRNENSEKPYYLTSKGNKETVKNGTHELRLTPSFTYDLGHGFTLGGKSAIVFMYKYEGYREGQMDMNTESQIGVSYSGFMPRWDIAMNFYREDTWYDRSNRKLSWTKEGYTLTDNAAKKDQVNQLRPSITYYFGNGANVRFDARIPLGNGKWVNSNDGTKGNESYETRYGFNYTFPVTPGFTATVGGTFLNYKDKTSSGEFKRYYAFRPNIGFSYSF